ncbi:hypothetical protein PGF_00002640 [Porphyromonas gingivalis 381]|nr:hypothetical protein PGF_00002640 [Porphyromonas gingivalis 381]
MGRENVARDFFRFGSGMKNFSRVNEVIYAPKSRRIRAAIPSIAVRKFSKREGEEHELPRLR